MKKFKIDKSEKEWKTQLGDQAYHILREKKGCDTELFVSETKFDSGCGWPSFDASVPGNIIYQKDTSFGRIRTEILCANCGGHLGHVFDDGPTETKQRYCVNSLSINFKKE